MTIYLDLVFFTNFFFDFLILFGTKYILKLRVGIIRLLLGSLLGSLSVFLLFLKINSIELFILKIIISSFMVLIAFKKNNFLKNYLYFYIISIFLGGVMYLLNNTFSTKHYGIIFINNGMSINFILMIVISPFIIYYYVKENLSYKNTISSTYLVDLYLDKMKFNLKGYLDTANTLTDPYKKRGIILMNLDRFNLKNKKIIYVPYKTITECGVIKCFMIDKVIINNKEFSNLLIGDIKNKFDLNNTDCLLPNIIKEEL